MSSDLASNFTLPIIKLEFLAALPFASGGVYRSVNRCIRLPIVQEGC